MSKPLIETNWKDRKRHLGLPLSFTKYYLNDNRIFCEKGLLNVQEEEVLLYRVRDLSIKINLWQRIFGVGTICVHSSDKTAPHLDLVNVKHPREVKEQIFAAVEEAKDRRRMRSTELIGDDPHPDGHEFDPDDLDN